jgi:hypothetical protein
MRNRYRASADAGCSIAIGLPTMSLRPTDDRVGACDLMFLCVEQLDHAARLQATSLGRFLHQQADALGAEPSTSFSTAIVSIHRCSAPEPIAFGAVTCTRMPSCTALSFKRCTRLRLVERAVAGIRSRSTAKAGRVPA